MQDPEEIWNLLHDGGISEVRGDVPGDLTLRVEIAYLTQRMMPPCTAIDVTLLGCETFEYLRWADDLRTSDVQILDDVEILSASATPEGVRVICSQGQFDTRYAAVSVRRGDGSATSLAEIEDVAAAYWENFGKGPGG